MRIVVIGAGGHSSAQHGPALKALAERSAGEVELSAVCDLDLVKAETYASAYGFARSYTDLTEMLRTVEPDAVFAITPPPVTETIASTILPMRIPLLIEKPPGPNAASTRRLLDIAERYESPHLVSLNRRFNPLVLRARAWLDENALQRPPRLLLARMLRDERREWDFIVETGIHLADTACAFLGPPTRVSSVTLPETGSVGFTQAVAQFEGGRRAHLFLSPIAGVFEETYEIQGEGYTIHLDVARGTLEIWNQGSLALSRETPADMDTDERQGTRRETEMFLEGVRTGRWGEPTLKDAFVSMRLVKAIAAGGETNF